MPPKNGPGPGTTPKEKEWFPAGEKSGEGMRNAAAGDPAAESVARRRSIEGLAHIRENVTDSSPGFIEAPGCPLLKARRQDHSRSDNVMAGKINSSCI